MNIKSIAQIAKKVAAEQPKPIEVKPVQPVFKVDRSLLLK